MTDENANVSNVENVNNGQVPVDNNIGVPVSEVPGAASAVESPVTDTPIVTPQTNVTPAEAATPVEAEANPEGGISSDNPLANNPLLNQPFPDKDVSVEVPAEPIIQKVIDVDKQKKIRLFIIIGVVVVILGIVVAVVLLPGGKKTKSTVNHRKVSNNYSMFVNSINDSIESGSFDKELNKALKEVRINTNTLSIMALDIDSDNELELVAYTEEGSDKYILQFEVYDGDILYEDKFPVNEKDSLAYAYSIKEDKTYWTTDYVSEYTIIKHPRRVLKSIEYLDGYYVITNKFNEKSFFENAVEYKSGYKLDALKLEKDALDYEKILEDSKLTKENVKDLALKYKSERDEAAKNAAAEQQNREIEENESALTLNLNGHVLHYGKYVESATIFYGDLVLHQNGVCEFGGNSCTWTYGNLDFGIGNLEQTIDITRGSEVIHLTSRSDNTITNCNNWSATHK